MVILQQTKSKRLLAPWNNTSPSRRCDRYSHSRTAAAYRCGLAASQQQQQRGQCLANIAATPISEHSKFMNARRAASAQSMDIKRWIAIAWSWRNNLEPFSPWNWSLWLLGRLWSIYASCVPLCIAVCSCVCVCSHVPFYMDNNPCKSWACHVPTTATAL